MIRRPPRSTRTDTLVPYTTLFRSLRLLVDSRPREQQLDCALHHRQWRAQLVADVGVELAVTLHHLGEALGVIVERGCKLADLVLGEMRGQLVGLHAVAGGLQAARQLRYRAHHPGSRPPADQRRQQSEYSDAAAQRAIEPLLALAPLGNAVNTEEHTS